MAKGPKCGKCQGKTSYNRPCGLLASCKVGCVKYCFIHAAMHSNGKCVDELDETLSNVAVTAERLRVEAEAAAEARHQGLFAKINEQLQATKSKIEQIFRQRVDELNAIKNMLIPQKV